MQLTHKLKCAGVFVLVLGYAAWFFGTAPSIYAQQGSAVGLWLALDGKSGKPKTHIRIWEEGGKLFGKTEKLFREAGQDPNPKCTKCEGERKDKPILGMTILWGMTRDGNAKWSDGKIMDPDDGKTYGCKLELVDGGKRLKVRGFMGVSMFGRTEYWQRVE